MMNKHVNESIEKRQVDKHNVDKIYIYSHHLRCVFHSRYIDTFFLTFESTEKIKGKLTI